MIKRFSSPRLWLYLLLLIGFAFRIDFFFAYIYHIDEYFSMLAANMVAQKGRPILPSGLFYDQGLILSYLSGGLISLLQSLGNDDFRVEVARWPSFLSSILTIAVYYAVGQTLFQSRTIGLLAATLATFDELSIVWGVRARMYTLAHLFVLLNVVYLIKGFFQQPNQHHRLLSLLFMAGALLSHTVSFMLLGPLVFLITLFTLSYQRTWLKAKSLVLEAVSGGVVIGLILWLVSLGQAGSTNVITQATRAVPPLGLDLLQGFVDIGWAATRFDELLDFYTSDAYGWLLPFVGISLSLSLYHGLRRQVKSEDTTILFLGLSIALVILEMGVFLTGSWQKARYMFILTFPQFMLLSAVGLHQTIGFGLAGLKWVMAQIGLGPPVSLRVKIDGNISVKSLATVSLSTILILTMWWSTAWRLTQAQGTGHYDTAFQYLSQQWQPNDKVITFHPAAAYLFFGQIDYYANQVTPLLLPDPKQANKWVDRYTGQPWLHSVDQLNHILAVQKQVWFVVDTDRLYRRYDPLFSQQIMAQMNWVYQAGQIYVFQNNVYPNPVPERPDHTLNISFSQLMRLEGYALTRPAKGPVNLIDLTLFWQLEETYPHHLDRIPKVFVQLRNGTGQTIAQADHFIFEDLLYPLGWKFMSKSEDWLRDMARLEITTALLEAEGPYRIYVGFYHPETFERISIVNDMSGEQAAVLDFYLPEEHTP